MSEQNDATERWASFGRAVMKQHEAAWADGRAGYYGDGPFYEGFLAGARYVLDAMTSEDMAIALARIQDDRYGMLKMGVAECSVLLAAVRKEIEG